MIYHSPRENLAMKKAILSFAVAAILSAQPGLTLFSAWATS
jgi:hypothetical protein